MTTQFSDEFFYSCMTVNLPTCVQNFIEISRLWPRCDKNAPAWFFGPNTVNIVVFRSFRFHKVVQRYMLGVVECLHNTYGKFPAESASKRIFKIGLRFDKVIAKD